MACEDRSRQLPRRSLIWTITALVSLRRMSAAAIPTPNPPRNEAITTKELSLHNGQDPTKPIWVAVKGTVFDVSRNKDAYGRPSSPIRPCEAWEEKLISRC